MGILVGMRDIYVRLTDEQHRILKEHCKAIRVPMAKFVRSVAVSSMKALGWKIEDDVRHGGKRYSQKKVEGFRQVVRSNSGTVNSSTVKRRIDGRMDGQADGPIDQIVEFGPDSLE